MNISFDRIKKYMQYFWLQCMQPHFLEEENFLFNSVEDEKVKKALSDHRQIEVLISDAMVAEETNVSEQLSKLANLVEAHVRYEERELFPHLEKELGATQLKHIGEQLNQTSLSEDDFEDAFWATKK